MPELPEVETIRRGLEKYLVGHKVERVEVRLKKIIKEGNPSTLLGARVTRVRRFGKALVMDLDPSTSPSTSSSLSLGVEDLSSGPKGSGQAPLSIVAHIKLTGQWVYQGPKVGKVEELPNKHTHVIFHLDRGGKLYFNDIRKFGWLRVVRTKDVEKIKFISELGPEPFDGLTPQKFREILSGKTTKIKTLLMDQKKIGGVGNIYANDALFLARIDPRRPAKGLSLSEQSKLYKAIEEVLKRGLKYGGATELNYVNALGRQGRYQEHFLVYGQEGKPCPGKCGGKVEKIRLGGRGTYFCPRCQK